MREIIPYFHELTIWLPVNIIGDKLCNQSWFFLKKKKTEKFGLTSQFSEFFDKICVKSFLFYKAFLTTLPSSFRQF